MSTTPLSGTGVVTLGGAAMTIYVGRIEGVRVSHHWMATLRRGPRLKPYRQDAFKVGNGPARGLIT